MDRKHGSVLTWDLQFLQSILLDRLKLHFNKNEEKINSLFEPPAINDPQTPYARFIHQYQLLPEERITLLLALVPHLHPNFFEPLIAQVMPNGGDFPEFGGVKEGNHRGILPTGETVLFVLAGNDLELRLKWQQHLFCETGVFAREQVLYLEPVKPGLPALSGKLLMDPDYVELFTLGQTTLPRMSAAFPAQHLSTALEWEDIVLGKGTRVQLEELQTWVQHHDTLMHSWGMHKKLKPGYRALFYGPPGTGKTFAATLLGKYTGKEVFKIDLSMVVSKYIGETEKNLASLFDKAQNKDWILFFDEADAIFGKRTHVRDAHDKYANQEVSYLLQRVEKYPGLTILASNFKSNMDDAFIRRFNAIIHFPLPTPQERQRIWQQAFPEPVSIAPEVDFAALSHQYELSGSHIMNVVQYTCLQALERGNSRIDKELLRKGILRELAKEGRLS